MKNMIFVIFVLACTSPLFGQDDATYIFEKDIPRPEQIVIIPDSVFNVLYTTQQNVDAYRYGKVLISEEETAQYNGLYKSESKESKYLMFNTETRRNQVVTSGEDNQQEFAYDLLLITISVFLAIAIIQMYFLVEGEGRKITSKGLEKNFQILGLYFIASIILTSIFGNADAKEIFSIIIVTAGIIMVINIFKRSHKLGNIERVVLILVFLFLSALDFIFSNPYKTSVFIAVLVGMMTGLMTIFHFKKIITLEEKTIIST